MYKPMKVKVNNEVVEIELHPRYSQYDIWYNVQDWRQDKLVRFYRRATHNDRYGHKKGEFYEMNVSVQDAVYCLRKNGRSPNAKPQLRRYIRVHAKQKLYRILCSRLTFSIGWAFKDESGDNQRYVIDHIKQDTLDDRPTNLREITQKENVNTPAANEARRRTIMKYHERRRQEKLNAQSNNPKRPNDETTSQC